MVRAAVLTLVAIIPALSQRVALFAVDAAPTDPTSFLPSLGLGGAVSGILFMWLRSEQKRGDKMEAIVADLVPALRDLKTSVDSGAAATRASTDAMTKMTENMEFRWPTRRRPSS